jgi:hypothetical protein
MTAIKIARQAAIRARQWDSAAQQLQPSRSRDDGIGAQGTFFKRGWSAIRYLPEKVGRERAAESRNEQRNNALTQIVVKPR